MQGLRKHAKMVRLRPKGSGKLSKAFLYEGVTSDLHFEKILQAVV